MLNQYNIKLDNGLNVCIIKREGYKEKFLKIYIKAGKLDEHFIKNGKVQKCISGTAHFLEHMMFKSKEKTENKMTSLGAIINAETDMQHTAYEASFKTNIKEIISGLFDMLNKPHFTKELIEEEKDTITSEYYTIQSDQENFFNKSFFASNYKRLNICGNEHSINNMTKESLMKFYNEYYTLDNMDVLLIGDFDIKETISIISEAIRNFRKNKKNVASYFNMDKSNLGKKFSSNSYNDYSAVYIGYYLDNNMSGQQKIKLSLALTIAKSIYFSELSDEYSEYIQKGELLELNYLDYVLFPSYEYIIIGYVTFKSNNNSFINYIQDIRTKKIIENDLILAKRFIKGYIIKSMEKVDNLVEQYEYTKQMGININDEIKALDNITCEEVEEYLYKIFDINKRVLVINR